MISFEDACRRNIVEQVKYHLNSGHNVDEKDDEQGGYSGLHYAAELGNLEVVEF